MPLTTPMLVLRMDTKKAAAGAEASVFVREHAMKCATRAYAAHTRKRLRIDDLVRHTVLGLEWAKHDPKYDGSLYELGNGEVIPDDQIQDWDGDYAAVRDQGYVPLGEVTRAEKRQRKAVEQLNALVANN